MPKPVTPKPAATPPAQGDSRQRELGPDAVSGQASGEEERSADATPRNFEAALEELETIVTRMEAGELTLEQSLSAYKRGAVLLQYCQAALKDAQQQVKVLEAGVLQDFTGADDNS